jgi:hypothetical protein
MEVAMRNLKDSQLLDLSLKPRRLRNRSSGARFENKVRKGMMCITLAAFVDMTLTR